MAREFKNIATEDVVLDVPFEEKEAMKAIAKEMSAKDTKTVQWEGGVWVAKAGNADLSKLARWVPKNIAKEDVVLNVPFNEKEAMKAIAGNTVVWNREKKSWVAKAGEADLAQLGRWLQRDKEVIKKPFHEVISEKLIKQLEEGVAPWQRPWRDGSSPINPITGNKYKGINRIQLMSEGFNDPRWLTYKQAQSMGAQVKSGEKGVSVQYWKFTESVDRLDESGKPMFDNNTGKKIQDEVKLEKPQVFFATVFNASQIDNMPKLEIDTSKTKTWDDQKRVEALLKNSGAKIINKDVDNAYYSASSDSIILPLKEQFDSAQDYYSTVLHELGHWTGHENRLNRDLTGEFGSESYAKEELRAEIASMITGDELQIGSNPDRHASYVQSWIKALKDDPFEILRASADAEKISQHVMQFDKSLNLTKENKIEPQVNCYVNDNAFDKINVSSALFSVTLNEKLKENAMFSDAKIDIKHGENQSYLNITGFKDNDLAAKSFNNISNGALDELKRMNEINQGMPEPDWGDYDR